MANICGEFGKVIYGLQLKLTEAVDCRLNQKSLEAVKSSIEVPRQRHNQIINALDKIEFREISGQQERRKIIMISQGT
jgi:hypothetical protein